jgi:NAD(P)-dependent dehydrogenase (short-subunit alcohol dehydrogenase family)
MNGSFALTGINAIVTGASGGIGREIAVGLAEAGANVGLMARRRDALEETARLVREAGTKAVVAVADVGNEADVQSAVGTLTDELGGVDVLVNNAGGARFMAPLLDVHPDGWSKVLGLNLTGPFLVAKAVVPSMIERGGGSIVNIGSLVSLQATPSLAAYAASKAGLIGLNRAMAREWGQHGIRANVVIPGLVRTEAWSHYENEEDISGLTGSDIPLGRWGTPREIADPVVFFASKASAYVNGTSLVVDGGALA